MHRFKRSLAALTVIVSVVGTAATSASASDDDGGTTALQQAVNAQLERAPGGTQISSNTVSYDGGHMLAVIADPSQSASANPDVTGPCPSGWFCIWTKTSKNGSRYQWQDTGVFDDLAAYGVPEPYGSYQNNRSDRMFMHKDNHGTPEQCYTGGTYVSNAQPWYNAAYAIYLATTKSC